MNYKKINKVLLSIIISYSTFKIGIITLNDEWDDIKYTSNLYFKNKFFFLSNNNNNNNKIEDKKKKKVIVLGSGWGAMSFIQKMDENNVDITVISPRSFFFYTPLLAGTSTGTVCHSSILEPIRWHTSRFGEKNFIQGECIDVDFTNKIVRCIGEDKNSELELSYDHLVIAVGAEPATFGIPGVAENAIFMKEIENGLLVQRKILETLERANTLYTIGASDEEINKLLHWIVIGGGPTGVELTAELNDFIQNDVKKYFPHLVNRIQVTLLEATDKILGMFDPKTSNYAQKTLIEHGAKVLCNSAVVKMTSDTVEVKKIIPKSQSSSSSTTTTTTTLEPLIDKLQYGLVVWAGGITARPIINKLAHKIGGEQIPQNGRPVRGLIVDNHFHVKDVQLLTSNGNNNSNNNNNDYSVWSLGDCTLSGCPPTAQSAYQQGIYLGRMLRNTNFNPNLINQYPSFQYVNNGSMAYLGSSKGVAELKNLLWDRYPIIPQEKNSEPLILEGKRAFTLWRSLYFTRLLSYNNKLQVIFDWCKSSLFGRDISSPYNLQIELPKEENKNKK